jgi:hypothetical protein
MPKMSTSRIGRPATSPIPVALSCEYIPGPQPWCAMGLSAHSAGFNCFEERVNCHVHSSTFRFLFMCAAFILGVQRSHRA